MKDLVTMTNQSNYIHPTAIIGNKCNIMGEGNYIGPYCILDNCTIGSNNRFESHVSIGSWPEARPRKAPEGYVVIEDDCEFREFVTINSGTQGATYISSRVLMLTKSHVGHDAIIEEDVIISCYGCIGGHSYVGKGANIGLGAMIHQRRAIGAFAMIGMNSTVSKHIQPGQAAYNREKPYATEQGDNVVGLSRFKNPNLKKYFDDWKDACENVVK